MKKLIAAALSLAIGFTAFGAPCLAASDSAKGKGPRSESSTPAGPQGARHPLSAQPIGELPSGLRPLAEALEPVPEAAAPSQPAAEAALRASDVRAVPEGSARAERVKEGSPAFQAQQAYQATAEGLRDAVNAGAGLSVQAEASAHLFDLATRKAMEAAPVSGAPGYVDNGLAYPAAAAKSAPRAEVPAAAAKGDSAAMTAFTVGFMAVLAVFSVSAVMSFAAGQVLRAGVLAGGAAAFAAVSRTLSLVGQSLDRVPSEEKQRLYQNALEILSPREVLLGSAAELGTGISETEFARAHARSAKALERGFFSSSAQAAAFSKDFERHYAAFQRPRLAALLRFLRSIAEAKTKEQRFIRAVAVLGGVNVALLLSVLAAVTWGWVPLFVAVAAAYAVVNFLAIRDVWDAVREDAPKK